MKRVLSLLAVGVVIGLNGVGPSARVRLAGQPDLSGTWTLISGTRAASSPLGAEGTIAQDMSSLTFSTGARSLRYRLDGSESRNDWNGSTQSSQARWVTKALLITTTTHSAAGEWEDAAICSLDAAGHLNVVTVNALKWPEDAMGTSLLVYQKKH
jgi:hypothetical protein